MARPKKNIKIVEEKIETSEVNEVDPMSDTDVAKMKETVEEFESIIPDNRQHAMVHEDRVIYNILGTSVLDLGCGIGRWGYVIKNKKPDVHVTGVEIHKPYAEQAMKTGCYDNVLNQSFTDLSNIPSKSYDTVIAIETIEHVTKDESIKLLKEMERIAKLKIVISTPSGFYELDTNQDSECHKCGWTKNELQDLGYTVLEGPPFRWEGIDLDKNDKPKDTKVKQEWLFCFKEL